MSSRPDLPQDLAACHALIGQQQATIDRLEEERRREAETIHQQQATIDQQQATIERLMADMALLKRALFGRRRERFVDDPRQTFLFDPAQQDAEEARADPGPDDSKPDEARQDGPPWRKGKGRRRRVFPECLPRKEARHELDEEDIPEDLRNDPAAKRFFKKTSEELEFEPASLYVIEHYQEVIVREEETGATTMATAPKPPRLIDAYTGPGFWAYLTASRFADHLPYYCSAQPKN